MSLSGSDRDVTDVGATHPTSPSGASRDPPPLNEPTTVSKNNEHPERASEQLRHPSLVHNILPPLSHHPKMLARHLRPPSSSPPS